MLAHLRGRRGSGDAAARRPKCARTLLHILPLVGEGVGFAEPPPPMEPVPWPRGFDDAGWLWQLKWDGVRCLAVHDGRDVRLWSRRGLARAPRYPEVAGGLPPALDGRPAVLDGELVVLGPEGRPSFHLTMRRAARARPDPALVRALPVTYAVFDLLALDGRDLRGLGVAERLERLAACLGGGPRIHRVETHEGGGAAFVAAVAAAGLEGAVAKRGAAPYSAGPSPDWRKVKPRRTLVAVVAGYRTAGGRAVRSLALAGYAGGTLLYVGDVGAGLTEAVAARLASHLRSLPSADPPEGAPPARAGDPRRWVVPELAVRVGYSEFTPAGHLRAPVLLDFVPGGPSGAVLP